jgi:hypothetical protein
VNALTKIESGALAVPFDELTRMAESMARAQLFGKQTPQQLLSLMLIAQANGQHPAAAARDYDVIQGRPSKKAEAMLRDFLMAGGKVDWHTYSDQKCDATFSHPQGGSIRVDWDHARVAQAKISNPEMYKKYPRNMLRARCISEGVRTVCPVATGGLYAPEEAASMPAERHMGDAEEVPAQLLADARAAADGGLASLKKWWKNATPDMRETLKPHIAELDALVAAFEAKPKGGVIDGATGEITEGGGHADH